MFYWQLTRIRFCFKGSYWSCYVMHVLAFYNTIWWPIGLIRSVSKTLILHLPSTERSSHAHSRPLPCIDGYQLALFYYFYFWFLYTPTTLFYHPWTLILEMWSGFRRFWPSLYILWLELINRPQVSEFEYVATMVSSVWLRRWILAICVAYLLLDKIAQNLIPLILGILRCV